MKPVSALSLLMAPAVLTLSACQPSPKGAQTHKDMQTGPLPSPAQTTALRITSEITGSGRYTDISFVPNSVASWLGQIILISDDGKLYRTRTGGGEPEIVSKKTHTDIYGLARTEAPGTFLALDKNGTLSAFIEINDDGKFAPLAITAAQVQPAAFCKGGDPLAGRAALIDERGRILAFEAKITDNSLITIGIETPALYEKIPALGCAFDDDDNLFILGENKDEKVFTSLSLAGEISKAVPAGMDSFSIVPLGGDDRLLAGLSQADQELRLQKGTDISQLIISDGLSLRGAEKANLIGITNQNMGSTYNEGVIVIQPSGAQRLMLISLAYAKKQLEAEP